MAVFQHIFWGYEVTYPESWIHRRVQDTDIFAASIEALDLEHARSNAGQVMIRVEWNGKRQNIEPLWNQHIGKLAGMMGAKNVGSAPWQLRDATGIEAEIVLPKKNNYLRDVGRLWTGVLVRDYRVLHFMVTHPIESRATFEPLATRLIASLRFPTRIPGAIPGAEGLPLPPGYVPADPLSILNDITDPQSWRAYQGDADAGALQAFYLRELPSNGWIITEFVSFPGVSELGFARLKLQKLQQSLTLGIMPVQSIGDTIQAALVVKLNSI